jgi:hypothetical protein
MRAGLVIRCEKGRCLGPTLEQHPGQPRRRAHRRQPRARSMVAQAGPRRSPMSGRRRVAGQRSRRPVAGPVLGSSDVAVALGGRRRVPAVHPALPFYGGYTAVDVLSAAPSPAGRKADAPLDLGPTGGAHLSTRCGLCRAMRAAHHRHGPCPGSWRTAPDRLLRAATAIPRAGRARAMPRPATQPTARPGLLQEREPVPCSSIRRTGRAALNCPNSAGGHRPTRLPRRRRHLCSARSEHHPRAVTGRLPAPRRPTGASTT